MLSRALKINLFVWIICFSLLLISLSNAQNGKDKKPQVRISPKASVTQTIGFTDVTISYSRPGVKGRKIWGGLVPYNKVWRAGANEATKITFSKDVMIEGKKLKAGSYGFFAIPSPNEWTLIFNKVADQWGAFTYNEAQDAIRIKVKPVKINYWQEWMEYTFSDMNVQKAGNNNSALINLVWEKLKVPFKVEVTTSNK
jgi:hypothetical protein